MDEEVYTVEDIFERDTPLTENLFNNSDGLTLSPITMLRRYMAKKELQKQNEKIEDDMEMDEESMGYMNGGGIGSMMQPRQNYAIGGDIENIINSAYPQGNFLNIKDNSPTQKDYNINVTKDLVENLPGGILRDILAPAAAATLSVPYDTIQGIGRAVDKSDVDRSPYGGIVDDMEIPRGPSLSDLGQAINAENPLSSMIGRTIGASGPLAERLSGMNFGMSEAAASEIDINDLTNRNNGNFLISAANALPNQTGTINSEPSITNRGVRTMEGSLIDGDDLTSRYGVQKDFPTSQSLPSSAGIIAALGSTGSNQLEGYQDMIMNPEGFPNALQNLERFQDNRFEDLDFQRGYDFKDAPNKTNTLVDQYQNRSYLNNPYTGIIDKNIMSRGNPDASLMNKTKNKFGELFTGAKEGIMNTGQRFKEGASKVPSLFVQAANYRNPLNPKAANYNPNLVGQLNALDGMTGTVTRGQKDKEGNYKTIGGSMLTNNPNTGSLQYGPGSVLRGKNAISGFGTNDYGDQLDEYIDKMKERAIKKDLSQFQTNKLADAVAERKRENDRQAAVDAAKAAEIRASAPAFNPNTTSGGRGSYRSDRDNSSDGGYGGSSKRSADNRSSDLGFSDIRLKDNIKLVGKSPSDINIYNFTYLNNPTVYQGVMAQEVPWASVKHDNGYLMVDYNKVDVDFKRQ